MVVNWTLRQANIRASFQNWDQVITRAFFIPLPSFEWKKVGYIKYYLDNILCSPKWSLGVLRSRKEYVRAFDSAFLVLLQVPLLLFHKYAAEWRTRRRGQTILFLGMIIKFRFVVDTNAVLHRRFCRIAHSPHEVMWCLGYILQWRPRQKIVGSPV